MHFLAALVEVDAFATPLVVAVVDGVALVGDVAVVGDVALVDVVAVVDGEAICPSSTKLMSSVEVGALAPGLRDQVGCLNIWIGGRGGPHSTCKWNSNCVHLIHWRLQRIGVMRTKVTASSPSSSTVVSKEASSLLNISIITLQQLD